MIAVVFHHLDFLKSFLEGRWTIMPPVSGEMWRQTAKSFGCTHYISIDVDKTDYEHNDEEILHEKYDTLDDVLEKYKDKTIVFLESSNNLPSDVSHYTLQEFQHPKDDVLYVFGHEYSGLNFDKIDLTLPNRYVVTVETIHPAGLWSVVAGGIILYNRMIKDNK